MCHLLCEGTILCDEETYQQSHQNFEYKNDDEGTKITIKGFIRYLYEHLFVDAILKILSF